MNNPAFCAPIVFLVQKTVLCTNKQDSGGPSPDQAVFQIRPVVSVDKTQATATTSTSDARFDGRIGSISDENGNAIIELLFFQNRGRPFFYQLTSVLTAPPPGSPLHRLCFFNDPRPEFPNVSQSPVALCVLACSAAAAAGLLHSALCKRWQVALTGP